MTRAAFAALAVVAAAGLLARSAAPVAACTCPYFPDEALRLPYQVEFADFIVVGTVDSLVDDTDEYVPDKDAQVSVQRFIKGSGPDNMTVDDPVGGGDCGFIGDFMVGQRWVFFLKHFDAYTTHLCAGNGQATDEYIAAIEGILNATPTPAATSPPTPTPQATAGVTTAPTPAALPDSGGTPSGDGTTFSDQVPTATSERVTVKRDIALTMAFVVLVALAIFLRFRKRP